VLLNDSARHVSRGGRLRFHQHFGYLPRELRDVRRQVAVQGVDVVTQPGP
jgi:hypothetical protein